MAGVGMVWPVRQPVVVEEARSQLVAGTMRELSHAQEDVVKVAWTTYVVLIPRTVLGVAVVTLVPRVGVSADRFISMKQLTLRVRNLRVMA